jgi:Cyclin D1 binding domain
MADNFEFNEEIPELQPGQPQQTAASSQRKRTSLDEVAEQRRTKYAVGDELHRLRHNVMAMSLELQEARRSGSPDDVADLEQSILRAQQYDAEFVYTVSLERMEVAERSGRFQEADRLRAVAMEARSALPQFNLSGLWVGKYGDQGYELINVTYAGDVLVAHKITGTKNVPKGEATFEVNLSPAALYTSGEPPLEPIELGESAANQWGSKYLQRFAGRGQVAAEGYLDSQWVDGQLILVNEYFSFAWLPIGHQVFFGRPTAELILKLMKDDTNSNVAESSARSLLERCWEETENVLDDMEVTDGPIVYSSNQHDYIQEGCFE